MAEGAKAAGASRIIGIDIDTKKFDRGTSPSSPSQYMQSIRFLGHDIFLSAKSFLFLLLTCA